MTSIQPESLNKDNSNTKNRLLSTTNHQIKQKDLLNPAQVPLLNNQLPCLNLPSGNNVTNKDHCDYFDNEILYQNNDPIFKEYTMINERKNRAIDDFSNNTQRIKVNNLKIEELKKNLIDLKEEKKQKHTEIINLLSSRETMEEIYNNNIYALNANITNGKTNSKNTNSNLNRKKDNNKSRFNYNNLSKNNQYNDEAFKDEDNFKISLNEIKESDQKKYVGQVISMFEDIFKKRDEKINSLIASMIKKAYEIFANNINQENYNEKNNDVIITNFFSKVSAFISNHGLGRYTENKINLFLRYLLKINAINAKLDHNIKFVSKKYQKKKKELNDMISFLEKKNINLADKNKRLENNMKEYDDKLEFYGKNDVFDIDKLDNFDESIYKEEKMFKKKNIIKKINNKLKNKDKQDQLDHDVIIEYEDGIDQNVDINYEDDFDYDYEKENEMIKKGLNPYNNEVNKFNSEIKTSRNNQNINKNNRQIIVKDNDENNNATNLSVMVIRNRSKRLNTSNEQNIKSQNRNNIGPGNQLNQTSTQPNNNEKKDSDKLSNKELEHYKRVQRIMNSGPKVGIFGVNNYNPEKNIYSSRSPFTPNKIENNITNSNKINKTIRIGSKDNHKFFSVINKTRMVHIKKKNIKDKENKSKDKSKKNNNDDTVINVINLEENFLSELKDDDKKEFAGNDSTSNITNNNSKSNKNISNENIENDDNYKSNKSNGESNSIISNNKNEVQGYFLNIIKENEKNNENNKDERLYNDNSLNENMKF